MEISDNRIFLKLLSPEDVSAAYVSWMQDEEVIQFLESRWKTYTMENLKEFVKTMNESPNDFLFGIFLKENALHIGNIKVGDINQIHRTAVVGLLIGNKNAWGKGYGTEAIHLATNYAFEELNMNKLTAGAYANNSGSCKAFIKAGYREVGTLKNHRFCKGKYVDEVLFEKCR